MILVHFDIPDQSCVRELGIYSNQLYPCLHQETSTEEERIQPIDDDAPRSKSNSRTFEYRNIESPKWNTGQDGYENVPSWSLPLSSFEKEDTSLQVPLLLLSRAAIFRFLIKIPQISDCNEVIAPWIAQLPSRSILGRPRRSGLKEECKWWVKCFLLKSNAVLWNNYWIAHRSAFSPGEETATAATGAVPSHHSWCGQRNRSIIIRIPQ